MECYKPMNITFQSLKEINIRWFPITVMRLSYWVIRNSVQMRCIGFRSACAMFDAVNQIDRSNLRPADRMLPIQGSSVASPFLFYARLNILLCHKRISIRGRGNVYISRRGYFSRRRRHAAGDEINNAWLELGMERKILGVHYKVKCCAQQLSDTKQRSACLCCLRLSECQQNGEKRVLEV